MQNNTGCKINVTQASGEDIEREIGLVGTRQAIELAKQAIWDKVETVVSLCGTITSGICLTREQREKNNSGGGGRRGGQFDNDQYSDRFSQQQAPFAQQQQGTAQGMPQQQPSAPAPPDSNGADPYAAWGGYQNYVAMWYAALAQQQQGGAQPPGPAQGPTPGTS